MWRLLSETGLNEFNQNYLKKRYALAQQLLELLDMGWSESSLKALLSSKNELLDLRVGAVDFMTMWQIEKENLSAKELLGLLVRHLRFPAELSGTILENQTLVNRFSINLAPHNAFWWDLANLVNQAFPNQELVQKGLLARQIHQLRYVISSQQAQYIRHHFGQSQRTDAEALASYLKTTFPWWRRFSYRLSYSARLHNKIKLSDGKKQYPSGYPSVNIKVLINFHTEFILDSQGNFLNEVDTQAITENGVVNGASFNYGRPNKRHWELDVNPVSPHDPNFRRQMKKGFKAPNRSRRRQANYSHSYFNPQGFYAENGCSNYQLVKQATRHFAKLLRRSN
ncbi:DUF3114 domain-containing protein [Streptococcus sp. sy004]|uniref:DUF3114 domain-containing protein n=1 Tax=Streptococcus sp. sy004 TaxID=2600149 RepID=UPI0021BDEDED|nr:DUF3114 domain-containing protein [Streptococcus sp. sy004]